MGIKKAIAVMKKQKYLRTVKKVSIELLSKNAGGVRKQLRR